MLYSLFYLIHMLKIIGGKWKGLYITTSKHISYRPITSSLRASFFNYLGDYIKECSFLDGFAGTGIIGFEALSRGARSCTFIENNKNAVLLLKRNIAALHASQDATVLPIKIEHVLSQKLMKFSNILGGHIDTKTLRHKGLENSEVSLINNKNVQDTIVSSIDIIFIDPPFQYPKDKLESLLDSITSNNILQKNSLLCVRYEKFHGKILVDTSLLRFIKEFTMSEAFLDIYQLT
ncbi:MAG: hypothetical protein A2Y62_14085 [Candidatus Fischerbacteria bacterium RBG_13_37_8]|uniref:16S rRNA (Guanine(966)-N(2))-methyltransferase RsmD n=1 Tax=Candidatus Fischerbacteria bacterium RBG_13_37_8 TaxID=1817863 RepID=A0A1F5VFL8_9BACT|nr:MAG: hypothetical protein A2Y62_14085 [Candidatus Fischerbacteria bacterium RBG_13_37_8]